ncbi:glycosyltransferase 61 family protein [Marixanthomonas spongiae]|uniref:Glycosyltransferase family 61 protein n=1 Tax=Marixanthomonas spongiae TaxID=2174845 RepID=A0A2U0I5B7_9FLAO|nr:hypothetical protein DDV96_03235 [Marixanthomonas spongiae]
MPIRLEELTYIEQVSLFYNAETIIATHGAGIANVIYGKNPLLIELFPKERTIRDAFYFAQLTSALKFRHEVIEYDSCNLQQDVVMDTELLKQIIDTLKNND